MSDIWVKTATGTSSTAWKKATNLFVKTATGTSSAAWSAVKNVYVRFSSGWTRVWPLSGVFNVTSPYITTSSGSTTPLYGSSGVRRVGSVVWGKNGTWNANGWVINSYQYRWRAYASSAINDLNIDSQTSLATYSSAVSLTIPATYDRKYLSFFIQANSSGGTAYNGYAESGVEYGGLQIVRQQPINISKTLSTFNPKVGDIINYSSSWNTTDAYAPEASRTSIEWYKNSSNSTSGGTFLSSGSYSYTVQSSDLNYYIYAVETTYNSGTDYDLGTNTGVSVSVITLSTVTAGLSAPTSVSIFSVSRANDTQCDAYISFSGGSGPYYQLYWTSSVPAPVTDAYDAAGTGSPILETFGFANNITYNFYVRSSSQNLGNTVSNGFATAETYSPYSTAYASYTFQSPSGATASISGTSTTGSTLTLSATDPTIAAPAATAITINWRVNDGGPGGNSFTGGSVLQSGGYTFVIPATMYGTSTVGYRVRAEITWNNGVGSQAINTNDITITAPATKLSTPSNVSASDNRSDGIQVSWTNVANAATYGVWWGGAPSYDSNPDFGGPNNNGGKTITSSPFLDDGVATGTTRDYYVQAFPTVGSTTYLKSNWSTGDSGTRIAAPVKLSTPTGVSATTTRTDGVNITWNSVSGAAYYGIWWGGPPGYDYAPDFGGPNNAGGWNGLGTSFLDTTISSGSSRTYYVQAYATGNPTGTKSDWSSGATGTRTSAPVTPAPSNLTINLSYTGAPAWTGSWSASNATSYTWSFYTADNSSGTNATFRSSGTGTSMSYSGGSQFWGKLYVTAYGNGSLTGESAWV